LRVFVSAQSIVLLQPVFGDPVIAHEPEIGVPTAAPLHDRGDDGSGGSAQDDPDDVHACSMTRGGPAPVCRSRQSRASQQDTIDAWTTESGDTFEHHENSRRRTEKHHGEDS
jgi:hypothetical protein